MICVEQMIPVYYNKEIPPENQTVSNIIYPLL